MKWPRTRLNLKIGGRPKIKKSLDVKFD